ncbi:MAG: hypothetical protein L0332_15550, partial [Chloroflexi bacterium]|nr:hypothetical protein [Chloroflexota bacterium]
FLYFTDVVKWAGAPFWLLPDALGLVERVREEDAWEAVVLPDDAHEISFTRPGHYYMFVSTYHDWRNGPSIRVAGAEASTEGHVPVAPVGRGTRPYDTTAVRGNPAYRFEIKQPGRYTVSFPPIPETRPDDKFRIGIAPDTITGNESAFATACYGQLAFLFLAGGLIYYFRSYRPGRARREQAAQTQVKKLEEMDDFLADYKRKQ